MITNLIIPVINTENIDFKADREYSTEELMRMDEQFFVDRNFSVDEYNLAIAHMVKEHKFNLIDVREVFKLDENFVGGSKELYSDDGLHPNQAGYKALTNFILNYKIDK
mgnify:CR=1 FL=1